MIRLLLKKALYKMNLLMGRRLRLISTLITRDSKMEWNMKNSAKDKKRSMLLQALMKKLTRKNTKKSKW